MLIQKMLESVKKIIKISLDDDKIRKFITICDDIYTKEYLGVDEYGKDVEYEKQLTTIATAYQISIFYDKSSVRDYRLKLIEKMKEKTPSHPSQLFVFE